MAVLTNEAVKARVSQNLRVLLADAGISQSELANRTGETVVMVNDLVHGRVLPNVATISRVAEALGVEVPALLSEPSKRKLPPIRRGPKPRKVPA